MSAAAMRCAVTGANGYVGSRVADYFAARNWTVFELARRAREHVPGRVQVQFELTSGITPTFFRDQAISTLIHCAYDLRLTKWGDIHRVNVEGSARLLRAAKDAGVDTIVLLSSISAFEGCSSMYGQAKLEIEKTAAQVGGFIIRPGLVYGSRPSGGVFGALHRLAARSSIVPLIGSGRYPQYLVHEDDLCALLFRIATGTVTLRSAPLVAADARAWSIRDLLRVLRGKHSSITFVPIPWPAIWAGLKAAELCGLPVPFRSDSVVSLVRQDPAPDFSVAARAGCRFREFTDLSVSDPSIG